VVLKLKAILTIIEEMMKRKQTSGHRNFTGMSSIHRKKRRNRDFSCVPNIKGMSSYL
jgi:hypothetical protein